MLGLISKGIVIGVLVSAPMGPIGMLCIQRTLNKGRWHGFVTGLGAALSDVIYAALTCLGMGVVVNFVEANQTPLQLIGSIVLGIFGYYIFQSNPVRNLKKQREKKLSFTQDFIVMRSSTAALLFVVKNWLWSSLMTFPFSFAITWETRTSSPGLSGRRTDTVKIRSLWISPFWITEDMVMTSIFPPLKIETIFLPLTSRCFNAATVRRPEFSRWK